MKTPKAHPDIESTTGAATANYQDVRRCRIARSLMPHLTSTVRGEIPAHLPESRQGLPPNLPQNAVPPHNRLPANRNAFSGMPYRGCPAMTASGPLPRSGPRISLWAPFAAAQTEHAQSTEKIRLQRNKSPSAARFSDLAGALARPLDPTDDSGPVPLEPEGWLGLYSRSTPGSRPEDHSTSVWSWGTLNLPSVGRPRPAAAAPHTPTPPDAAAGRPFPTEATFAPPGLPGGFFLAAFAPFRPGGTSVRLRRNISSVRQCRGPCPCRRHRPLPCHPSSSSACASSAAMP